jgi:SAM-dependent methyltransferase
MNETEALVGRLFEAGVGAVELCNIYLGVKLGLYAPLAAGPVTATELAEQTGCSERYLVEWLQGQAIAGLATVDGDDPATARFLLADGAAPVLIEETSPAYLGGLPLVVAATGGALPALARAFRTGEPVPYAEYGPDAVEAQAALNRPAFTNELAASWLPQIPDVAARLNDETHPARVGDFACGYGWSAIELARAFPSVRVDGFDSDEASIAAARRFAAQAGVADRVRFEVRDLAAATPGSPDHYDVVFFFECVHDFPRPVEVLAQARTAVAPMGTVIVMDERAAETFTAPGDLVERFFAAASPVWCLPQGLVGPDPQPVGTLMRPDTLRALATKAGFSSTEVLPIEHGTFRFYRLVP